MKFQSKLFSLVSLLLICSGCSHIQSQEIKPIIIYHSTQDLILDSNSNCSQELKNNKYEIKC